MKTHTLKCWTEQFAEIRSGRKTFEFRQNDRGFDVGDVLDLRDFDPVAMMYSGLFELRRVTHILSPGFGLPEGYVVMSMEAVECCGEPVHDGDPCGYILECCGKYRSPSPQPNLMGLDEATKQKLREALRFSASRSVMSAEDERRILSALDAPAPVQHVEGQGQ